MFRLLYDSMGDQMHGNRYVLLHAALTTISGSAMRKEFEKEKYIVSHINR